MSRVAALVVALAAGILAASPVAQACGDKFMMAGRGPKFQRVYASVYPGKVLIYANPTGDRKAGILNSQLHKVLRQAGHAVTVVEDWAHLEQAIQREAIDVLLVDANDAARVGPLVTSSRGRPEAMYVADSRKEPPAKVVCRLKATDGERKYLEEIENVMKARTKLAKAS